MDMPGLSTQVLLRSKGSLYEDCHRSIIEDCNGQLACEDSVTSQQQVSELSAGNQIEDEEGQDELAPLPKAGIKKRPCNMLPTERGHMVLLIDTSGSMRSIDVVAQEKGEQPDLVCRLEAAIKCAHDFVHAHWKEHPRDYFSLATFGDTAKIEATAANA